MAANGITVLKQNVPWGPFSRAQIEEGVARGDFTLKYLAHAPGLTEWLPLGEVLDHVARRESLLAPTLPPLPESRELPPIPARSVPPVSAPVFAPAPVTRPPVLPAPPPKNVEPAPVKPQAPPIVPAPEPSPAPASDLEPAPFFRRGIAFLVDCGILFLPLILLFVLGILSIEVPRIFHKINPQTLSEDRDLLWLNLKRMAFWLAVGCGWIYASWYESSESQATIGKRWVGLKVVDEKGERISFLRASGRFGAKFISALPCFLGFIAAIFSSRALTLHDRLSGTRVVRD